ncbi:Integrase [gamma proteobacterium IMCC1989]|nr:Integrase [gamma proteobacterium IMCC1989]
MAINKLPDGRYELDIYPSGRNGKRIKRIRNTKKECRLLEADILREFASVPDKFARDNRSLIDLVDLWYSSHGHTLKDAKYRYSRTLALCDRLSNPSVSEFTSEVFSIYRQRRLSDVSVSTVNHETRYLRSVFNELKRLGFYYGDNPLANIRTFPERQRELSFLTYDQRDELLYQCEQSSNTHCAPVVRLCLATGSRWSEANGLKASNLFDNRVIYSDTKNGKQRVIPITSKLSSYLRSQAFPTNTGRLFDSCRSAFRKALERTSIELPQGQSTHVLRHTYASHFVMKGGDILTLKNILGHSDLKVTMRYAHLSPDYMQQAVELSSLDF